MLEMLRATLCAWMLVPSPIFHQAVNGICLISTLFSRKILEVHFFEQFEKDFLGGRVDHEKESTGAKRCLIDQASEMDFS